MFTILHTVSCVATEQCVFLRMHVACCEVDRGTPQSSAHNSSSSKTSRIQQHFSVRDSPGPSSSLLLGPARTPRKLSQTFEFCWSEFIPRPGISSNPSQIWEHPGTRPNFHEFLLGLFCADPTPWDQSKIFMNFCWGRSELIMSPGFSSDPCPTTCFPGMS